MMVFALALSIISLIAFVIFSLAADFRVEGNKLILMSGSDVPDIFYSPELKSNFTQIIYVLPASDSGNEIVMPGTNFTSADDIIRSNDGISIVAYYDAENQKTIPYIKMGNGRFIGKNFSVEKDGKYIVWNKNELNLTFDLK